MIRYEAVIDAAKIADSKTGTFKAAMKLRRERLEKEYDAEHKDNISVDRFAAAMKAKLARKREEGRGGWDNPEECSVEFLSKLLREHIDKGDPIDVGNFAMMIHQLGGTIE